MCNQRNIILLLIPSVCKRPRTISSELHKDSERNKESLHQREQCSRFFLKSALNLQQLVIIGVLHALSLSFFSISFECRDRFEISRYLAKMLENRTNIDRLIYTKETLFSIHRLTRCRLKIDAYSQCYIR